MPLAPSPAPFPDSPPKTDTEERREDPQGKPEAQAGVPAARKKGRSAGRPQFPSPAPGLHALPPRLQGAAAQNSALTVRPVPSTITSYSSFMAGQARTEAQRTEKAPDTGRGRGYMTTPRTRGKRSGRPRAEEKGKSGGEGEQSCRGGKPAATSDGKRRAGPGGEGGRKGEGQAGGEPDLRCRAGRRGGARRAAHHTLLALSLATSPSPAQHFFLSEFSRDEGGTTLAWIPVPRSVSSNRDWERRGSRAALEGWGGSVLAAGEWLTCSLLPPPCGSRRPEAPLDFEPAPATWAGTRRRGLGRCGRPARVRPTPPGGCVKWPDPRCGRRRPAPDLSLGSAWGCHMRLSFATFFFF